MLKKKNPGIAKEIYHRFRQGLDIIDLDHLLDHLLDYLLDHLPDHLLNHLMESLE